MICSSCRVPKSRIANSSPREFGCSWIRARWPRWTERRSITPPLLPAPGSSSSTRGPPGRAPAERASASRLDGKPVLSVGLDGSEQAFAIRGYLPLRRCDHLYDRLLVVSNVRSRYLALLGARRQVDA